MKDMTSESTQTVAGEPELQARRNPIAIIGLIVILAAIVYGVWELAHLVGR